MNKFEQKIKIKSPVADDSGAGHKGVETRVFFQTSSKIAELCFRTINRGKYDTHLRCRLVQKLQLGVVAQDIKDSAVRLPQKLEPRSEHSSISSIFVVLVADHHKKQAAGVSWPTGNTATPFRRFTGLQVFKIEHNFLQLPSCTFNSLFGCLQIVPNDIFERSNSSGSSNVLVLVKTILCLSTLAVSSAHSHDGSHLLCACRCTS